MPVPAARAGAAGRRNIRSRRGFPKTTRLGAAAPTDPLPETWARRANMLGWAITFFIVAIIAAILGFGGIAGSAVAIAQILFVVFLVLFLVSLVWHLISGRRPPVV
jgi:uncharacterized membrane protein YtjA (UPF0391 family)